MASVETVDKVDLGADELMATFTIDGFDFRVECYEAYDEIRKIERAHLLKAEHHCRSCCCGFVWPESQWGEQMRCPKCSSDDVEPNNDEQWAAIAAYVRKAFGAPRCGRTAAITFYNTVLDTVGVAKKKNEQEPESPTGSDSTQEAGENAVPSVG